MASLTLRQIVKRYGNNDPTLKGIDLEVEDGEFLVLVGPSGCGKSTLLRIIAGLESITDGDLSIGERVVNTVPPKERDIAMVFQSYALYPHMTVKRNMSFGLEVRKTPRDEIDKLVNDAARMLGLETQLEKLPKQLSGGQRQRVAMGRAIVRRPKVFLFDEPLSNLDAKLRAQMRVEIKRLHLRLATTMVYVTHDQVEAMTLAERIAVLDKGVLQQVGTPLQLFNTPTNRFVAGFIGSPSMNFLDATIEQNPEEDTEGWVANVPGAGSVPVQVGKGLEKARRVILGLRPQDLKLVDADHHGALMGRVDVVETLGWESHVHLDVDGTPVLAAVEARDAIGLAPGDNVHVAVDDNAYHLFDAQTEEAIQHGASKDRPVKHEQEAEAG